MAAIASVLVLVLWLFVIVIFVRVIISWVSPYPTGYSRRPVGVAATVGGLAYRITEPVLAPVRRWLPPVSGLDLSPLVVTVACYFLIHALSFVG